jgi:hypothetical protein
MEIRPLGKDKDTRKGESRGSGPGARKRRSDALGVRKDVIIRMPEDIARQLKVVAACENMTVNDFCLEVILPHIEKSMEKHGLSAEQISR